MNAIDKMVLVCALDSAIASEEKLLAALNAMPQAQPESHQSSLLLSHYKRLRREMYHEEGPRAARGTEVLR